MGLKAVMLKENNLRNVQGLLTAVARAALVESIASWSRQHDRLSWWVDPRASFVGRALTPVSQSDSEE